MEIPAFFHQISQCTGDNQFASLLLCFWIVSNESGDVLQQQTCALLSLPWVRENKSASAYRTSGFPLWLPVVAEKLHVCLCEWSCTSDVHAAVIKTSKMLRLQL